MYSAYGNQNLVIVNPTTRPKILQVKEKNRVRPELTEQHSHNYTSLADRSMPHALLLQNQDSSLNGIS